MSKKLPAPVVRTRIEGRPLSRVGYFRLKHAADVRDKTIAKAFADYHRERDLIFKSDGALRLFAPEPYRWPWQRGEHALEGLSALAHMTPRDLWRLMRGTPRATE